MAGGVVAGGVVVVGGVVVGGVVVGGVVTVGGVVVGGVVTVGGVIVVGVGVAGGCSAAGELLVCAGTEALVVVAGSGVTAGDGDCSPPDICVPLSASCGAPASPALVQAAGIPASAALIAFDAPSVFCSRVEPRASTCAALLLAASLAVQAAPAHAQLVSENRRLTLFMVDNLEATSFYMDFDAAVCSAGGKSAVILASSANFSFLISIAMGALSSNRRLRVTTDEVSGLCQIRSLTILR
jgi:hypothetical protein